MTATVARDPIRCWVSRNLAVLAFLGAYFVTIVAGNLVYATPLGEHLLTIVGYPTAFLDFETTFTVGYWVLLLSPFAVIPVALGTRRIARRPMAWAESNVVDLSTVSYATLLAILYAGVLYSFLRSGVVRLFIGAHDDLSSIEARFEILDRIGFSTLVVLQALLPFLAIYGLIRALKEGGLFWKSVTAFNVVAMTLLLILINMKWPVLLFQVGLIMTVFVYSARRAYLRTAIGATMMIPFYLVISMIVFRVAPPPPAPEPLMIQQERNPLTVLQDSPAAPARESHVSSALDSILALPLTAVHYAPGLLAHGINRMAVTYPYYYRIFTEEGPLCGGWFDQLRRGQECRPSWVVYSRIFPGDGFAGRGTSGTAVNISGYAVGGWLPATALLFLAAVILGLFISLPVDRSALSGALVITGGLTGYFMSQLPLEGVLIHSNGIIWTGAMVLIMIGIGWVTRSRQFRNDR